MLNIVKPVLSGFCKFMHRGKQGSPCQNPQKRLNEARQGEVAEWLNAPVSKTGMGRSPSRVRIPPSPPPPNAAERIFGACVGGRRTTERRGAVFWCLCWGWAHNGARGLAGQVNIGLRNADSGLGLTAGLSMAFLAMMADRILRGFVRVFT